MLELYMINTAHSSFIYEDSYKTVDELYQELLCLNNKLQNFVSISKRIQDELRTLKNEFTKLSEEDKAMERSFRKNIQISSPIPLDQDTVKMLFGLYNKRNERDIIDKKGSSVKGKDKRRPSMGRPSGRKMSLNLPLMNDGRRFSDAESITSQENANTLSPLATRKSKETDSSAKISTFASKNDPFLGRFL